MDHSILNCPPICRNVLPTVENKYVLRLSSMWIGVQGSVDYASQIWIGILAGLNSRYIKIYPTNGCRNHEELSTSLLDGILHDIYVWFVSTKHSTSRSCTETSEGLESTANKMANYIRKMKNCLVSLIGRFQLSFVSFTYKMQKKSHVRSHERTQ